MTLQGFSRPSPQGDGIPGRTRGSLWPSVSSSPRLPTTTCSICQLPSRASYGFPVSVSFLWLPFPTPTCPPFSQAPALSVPEPNPSSLASTPTNAQEKESLGLLFLCVKSLHGVFSFSIKDFISTDLQRPHISSAAKTNQCHMSQINPSKDSKELMIL